jgi:hypothetical protein
VVGSYFQVLLLSIKVVEDLTRILDALIDFLTRKHVAHWIALLDNIRKSWLRNN